MLLFSNKNNDIKLANAVHYAAQTSNKDSFFTYVNKGSTGKYNGYFIREPFFKKLYEYNTLEQRYIYIYHLNYSKKEIEFLIYHLYELRKATFKYYFLDENCATQTADLVQIISGYKRKEKLYYLPIDVLKQYKNNIIKEERFIPLINKINLLNDKMTLEEKKLFNNIINTNNDVNESYPDIVKEALVDYSTFRFRRFHRWNKNYNNIMNQTYIKQDIIDKSKEPLEKTQSTNIGFGIIKENNDKNLFLYYRPLFINLDDLQFNNLQQSEVDVMSFYLYLNKNTLKLENLTLLSLKSFSNQSYYYKPSSWSLYSGLNKYNKDYKLKFNNEFGIGRSVNYFNINSSFLFYLGLDNIDIYLKPYININKEFTNHLKIGYTMQYKKYIKGNYINRTIYSTIKYNNILYKLKFDNENIHKINFSINFNF